MNHTNINPKPGIIFLILAAITLYGGVVVHNPGPGGVGGNSGTNIVDTLAATVAAGNIANGTIYITNDVSPLSFKLGFLFDSGGGVIRTNVIFAQGQGAQNFVRSTNGGATTYAMWDSMSLTNQNQLGGEALGNLSSLVIAPLGDDECTETFTWGGQHNGHPMYWSTTSCGPRFVLYWSETVKGWAIDDYNGFTEHLPDDVAYVDTIYWGGKYITNNFVHNPVYYSLDATVSVYQTASAPLNQVLNAPINFIITNSYSSCFFTVFASLAPTAGLTTTSRVDFINQTSGETDTVYATGVTGLATVHGQTLRIFANPGDACVIKTNLSGGTFQTIGLVKQTPIP